MRWLRAFFVRLIVIFAGLYGLCVVALVALRWINPITTTVQAEKRVDAVLAHKAYVKRYQFVPLSRISRDLQHAVIAAEDARFYEHHGFD